MRKRRILKYFTNSNIIELQNPTFAETWGSLFWGTHENEKDKHSLTCCPVGGLSSRPACEDSGGNDGDDNCGGYYYCERDNNRGDSAQ